MGYTSAKAGKRSSRLTARPCLHKPLPVYWPWLYPDLVECMLQRSAGHSSGKVAELAGWNKRYLTASRISGAW